MVDILYEVMDIVDMVSNEHQSAVEVGSLGEGTRSGWKSSQGGTSLKAADLKEGREPRNRPEGWKDEMIVIEGQLVGEGGVNTPTASLRIKYKHILKAGRSIMRLRHGKMMKISLTAGKR